MAAGETRGFYLHGSKPNESVGYVDVFRDEESSALRVQPGSGKDKLLRYETATLVLMGKGVA